MNLRLARNARIRWSGWLIASLLFLQLASAAYACTMGTGAAEPSMAGMPCAQQMAEGFAPALDPEQPGLCLEHCKGGSQTVEPSHSPAPLLPALVALFVVAPVEPVADASAWLAQDRRRERAPPPAHSILHCCYRL